jgi:hypothetical protein
LGGSAAAGTPAAGAGAAAATATATVIVVRGVDFYDALSELTPSLTDQDVAHYLRLRESFEGNRGTGKPGNPKP